MESGKICIHESVIKIENDKRIIFCKKCGRILDARPLNNDEKKEPTWNEAFIYDNCGIILHD